IRRSENRTQHTTQHCVTELRAPTFNYRIATAVQLRLSERLIEMRRAQHHEANIGKRAIADLRAHAQETSCSTSPV
ncbi:hypothetical protein J6590_064275, partial [Homalodisca vitripennis]